MLNPIKISCVVGARPNFIKMAAVLHEFRSRPAFRTHLVHTGQHFSPEMSDMFFKELSLPEPDRYLDVGPGTPTWQTSEIMRGLEAQFLEFKPDAVLVVGDVNSTLAAALTAPKLSIPLIHVEAGLRSFDRAMPEEINRLITDVVSDYLFVSEPSGVDNLRREGISADKIFFVGNVMIDTLLRFRSVAQQSRILESLALRSKSYALVTLHRPSNVDDPVHLAALTGMLDRLAHTLPVVFPVHPRTRHKLENKGIFTKSLNLIPPLGYIDFVRLMSEASIVLTDSGGVQEETTILQTPCLTMRDNTERPITIEEGTNRLAGTDPDSILQMALQTINQAPKPARIPKFWDGCASERIADILESHLSKN